jgi:isoleucyl-tRNA synthetase
MADQHAPPTYKETLALPQTAFAMRAGAAQREPQLQTYWDEQRLYHRAIARRKAQNAPPFVLHDGPPYLSSDKIHIGTALNKVLKDIVTRYKTARGYWSPYVPGYDGHGLPIEAAVEKKIKGGRRSITELELREQCRRFALGNVKGQEANFRRLGVWGDWENPYITIDGHFEATQVRQFAKMVAKGYVYKGLKPVHWCPVSESAMAEAEIDYADHESHSIYVAFPLTTAQQPQPTKQFGATLPPEALEALAETRILIWTTTPWTLPSNVALAVHPKVTYVVLHTQVAGKLLVAQPLVESVLAKLKEAPEKTKQLLALDGTQLEGLLAHHPLCNRTSVVLTAEFVTTDTGTGIVHIAPGHGPDDFIAVQNANRGPLADAPLPILSPINSRGVFLPEPDVPEALHGQFYEKANWLVLDLLKEQNALLSHGLFTHSYPHSWRSHAPVIFRATEQWFININAFRDQALAEIGKVQWIPARGEARITTMVANRHEWCVSRQRVWGVPIPAFYCQHCGTMHLTPETTEWMANLFEAETSDAWAKYTADEILAGRLACSGCGHTHFNKEADVMDVWFDSGVTHTAVVEARKDELGELPVALYLEGSDQHRGWFQSSLLTSVMVRDAAPFKAVLTHGFVLDEHGRKMSKSLGNVVDPNTVMNDVGADVLRLWVASVDYANDVKLGPNALKQLADIYRKIRNTLRFLLGNLHGFDPAKHAVPVAQLGELDRYVLHRTQHVTQALTDAFDKYEFHRFYQLLQNFCVVELSSLYFDVVKDVLYCHKADHPDRRAVQTVLYALLSTLIRLIVPVMPHLAEDAWAHWPVEHRPTATTAGWDAGQADGFLSPLLADWPVCPAEWTMPADRLNQFEALLALREAVNATLEEARTAEAIGSALEACVLLVPKAEAWAFLTQADPEALATLLLTSQAVVLSPAEADGVRQAYAVLAEQEAEGCTVLVAKALGAKCDRCWKHQETVGEMPRHPTLCHRCHEAVG